MTLHELMRAAYKADTSQRPAVPAGTIAPGTKVRKLRSEPEDTHQAGALATTLGFPMGPVVDDAGVELYGYFVEWDDLPFVPVFIRGDAIEPVEQAAEPRS